MWNKQMLFVAVAATFVAACSGSNVTPTTTPIGTAVVTAPPEATVAASPVASPVTTARPTPTAGVAHSIADLLATPSKTVSAADVAAVVRNANSMQYPATAYQIFLEQCASTWAKTNANARLVDRQLGCLAAIGIIWNAYAGSPSTPEPVYTLASAIYSYAVNALGSDTKAFLDRSLGRLGSPASASTPPAVSTLESLDSVAKVPLANVAMLSLHKGFRDAVGANLEHFVPQWPFSDVNIIAACESATPAGRTSIVGNVQYNECAGAGEEIWQAYLATGDPAFFKLMTGIEQWILLHSATTVTGMRLDMPCTVGAYLKLPVTCQ